MDFTKAYNAISMIALQDSLNLREHTLAVSIRRRLVE